MLFKGQTGIAHVMTRILIADDHEVVRDWFGGFLERHTNYVVVAEAADGEEAIAKAPGSRSSPSGPIWPSRAEPLASIPIISFLPSRTRACRRPRVNVRLAFLVGPDAAIRLRRGMWI